VNVPALVLWIVEQAAALPPWAWPIVFWVALAALVAAKR
jgi:hypothetical protein